MASIYNAFDNDISQKISGLNKYNSNKNNKPKYIFHTMMLYPKWAEYFHGFKNDAFSCLSGHSGVRNRKKWHYFHERNIYYVKVKLPML